MRIIDRLASLAGGRRGRAARVTHLIARAYDAARSSRATWGWIAGSTSANAETLGAIPVLRDRARDLVRNNPYAAKAIDALVNNSIGAGVIPRAKTGDPALNEKIDELWARFEAEIDADGTHDFYGLQHLCARAFFESGEVLIRRRPRRINDGLMVPLQYQVVEADLLDHRRSETLADGRIVQGVEFDRLGRRRAYWLLREHPGDHAFAMQARGRKSFSVRAESLIHLYDKQRPGQVRGVPWIAPAMIRMRMLEDYEESEIVRKRTEACVAAIVFSDEESEEGLAPTVRDAAGNLIEQFEPGLIAYSRGGKDVKFTQPSQAGGYENYKRSQVHSIAAGTRVPYELISGDLSQVNFSSFRAGMIEFRRMIEALQWTVFVPVFLNRVWRDFIDTSIAAELLPRTTPHAVEWTPPRFETIDPVKETLAKVMATRAGFVTLKQAISEMGFNPDEVLAEIAETNDLLDQLGIVLDSDPRRVTKAGGAQPVDLVDAVSQAETKAAATG